VIASEVDVAKTDWKDADGAVTSVERREGRGGPIFIVSFNYKVGEHWYGGFYTTDAEMKEGDYLPVRYDPDDPDRNDLVEQEKRSKLFGWLGGGAVIALFLLARLVGCGFRGH